MKILFLSDLLAYGGASKLIYDLLPRMADKGHQCELLILTDKSSKYIDDLRERGIPVNVVPDSAKGHFARIKFIRNRIEKGNYDVIHANLFPTTYYCSIVKRILGEKCPPLVMTEHSTDNKRRHKSYLRTLEKFIYQKYDHVISISDKTQENLCQWLGTEGDSRFTVIQNGIDVDRFSKAKPVSHKELYSGYKDGDILLLTVGSFTPQKNHGTLINALAQLPDHYKLLLAGEGPLLDEIKNKVKTMSLESRVAFLGFRRDIDSIMHSVDVLVIPSIWEGFGLIAAEGMACGLPIAASDIPGLAEVVGDAGLKFNPEDPKDISNTILSIKNHYADLKKNAQELCDKYDINCTVNGYLWCYEMCLRGQN